jgi:hypothetical protein
MVGGRGKYFQSFGVMKQKRVGKNLMQAVKQPFPAGFVKKGPVFLINHRLIGFRNACFFASLAL